MSRVCSWLSGVWLPDCDLDLARRLCVVLFVSAWTAATASAAEQRDVMAVYRRLFRVSRRWDCVYLSQPDSPRLMETLHCPFLMSWSSCSGRWPVTSKNNWPLLQQWAAARFWHLVRGWQLDHQHRRRRLTSASTTFRSVRKAKTVQRAINQVLNPPSDNGDDPVGAPNKSARRKRNKNIKEVSQSPAEGYFLLHIFF